MKQRLWTYKLWMIVWGLTFCHFVHASLDHQPYVLAYGSKEAPVHMVEFSSITCPHCAEFHHNVLPLALEKYIKTGKLYLECHDYPDNELAMNATVLVHCARTPEEALQIRELLFKTQSQWLFHAKPWDTLCKIIKPFLPLSPEECLKDQKLFKNILDRTMHDYHHYHITHTPSFMVGNKLYPKALTLQEFELIMDGKDPKITSMRYLSLKKSAAPASL